MINLTLLQQLLKGRCYSNRFWWMQVLTPLMTPLHLTKIWQTLVQ